MGLREPTLWLAWETEGSWFLGGRERERLPVPHIASASSGLPAPGSRISFASCRAQTPTGVRTEGFSWGKVEVPIVGCLQPSAWDLPAAAPFAASLVPLGPPVGCPHLPGVWPANPQGRGDGTRERGP